MADTKPHPEAGLFRVVHSMNVGDATMTAESDLIFDEKGPILVVEWDDHPTNNQPRVTLRLDPAKLTESPSRPGYFDYSGWLRDPRTRH